MEDLGKTSLVGRTLAHYRISAVIGAGGMGEVYRATDRKLARDIALKVLPSDMASDPDRLARFQREARAIAALNHPNVVTVYSVEESENVHFITMELIEGQPLDRLISANGLPVEQIIEIAGAIAEALAAAHQKGIVHRDLKPANVMVTNEGRVKVLDFGLAKDVGAETTNDATLTATGRTQPGTIMGTLAYMSPEQLSGRPLDNRSDIFSYGVMMHEMAAGRRPFEGSSSAELISSILRDTPSVTDARPDLPSDLVRVIRRCLEKDPAQRYPSTRMLASELRTVAKAWERMPKPTVTSKMCFAWSMPLSHRCTRQLRDRSHRRSQGTGPCLRLGKRSSFVSPATVSVWPTLAPAPDIRSSRPPIGSIILTTSGTALSGDIGSSR